MKIAILYQAQIAPIIDGVQKPMKKGGYSDSGADIGYALKKGGLDLITPVTQPDVNSDLDWVFPDTVEGIGNAIEKGATVLWLNTVLYSSHPIMTYSGTGIQVIGQRPSDVDLYDDKFFTNQLLKKHKLPIPDSILIHKRDQPQTNKTRSFPLLIKPIRGRGSQGVKKVDNPVALRQELVSFFENNTYGDAAYLENYLPGMEITLTVLPAGTYSIQDISKTFDQPWCLPVVHRFNHQNGIAPYSGKVAVVNNSSLCSDEEQNSPAIQKVIMQCSEAARLLDIKAPIRIDCRADEKGDFYLFDLNLKPNMTGASRPHRMEQDSLSTLAAKGIRWSYYDFLINILVQRWEI